MAEKITLNLYEIVGGPIWVSTEDGQKVYEKIVAAFRAERSVELSFANRQIMITAFLNAAVGQLYNGDFAEDFLSQNLSAVDISGDDLDMLGRAVENAKAYFKNREGYDRAWKEEVGDEGE
jgi:hypothetical protein